MELQAQTWIPLSRLGCGSFGHVSLALSLHDSSLFAVKSCSPAASAQLLNEIQILSSLSSPYVVQCLGADAQRRQLFVEFMDGGSLNDAIKRHPKGHLPESLAGQYTHSILSALHYLHDTAGVVHGDVKSHNVLLKTAGSAAKLADFGAAHHHDTANPGPPRGGTPLWMAPEVAQGVQQGPASDIWSLGCTLMEMLQGGIPWMQTNVSAAATLLKVACSAEDPALSEQILNSCSAAAQDFLRQCLRRDPRARPSAAELLQHPFVQSANAEKPIDQLETNSPRSTLFSSLFDSSDIDCSSSSSNSSVSSSMDDKLSADDSLKAAAGTGHWITVKRSNGWSDDRQLNISPFTPQNSDGTAVVVKKASEVRLDTIAFLMSRNRRNGA